MGRRLPHSFFDRPTLNVARESLGKHLVRRVGDERLVGRIVEVEAYHQQGDRAAHSFGGMSQRNSVMFGPPGHLYVYFIYGMHFCMNLVTEPPGIGAAVLIRALEPVEGEPLMRLNRPGITQLRDLTNGPAKACRAFAVDQKLNGADLEGPEIWVEEVDGAPLAGVASGPRIGISKSVDLAWRFWIPGNRFCSR